MKSTLVLLLSLLPILEVQGDERTDRDIALAANTSARESIRTIHLKITITEYSHKEPPQITKGEYWRDGDMWRLEYDEPQSFGDKKSVCDGKTTKSLLYSWINGKHVQTGAINHSNARSSVVDPWETAMMVVHFSKEKIFSIQTAIERGVKLKRTSRQGDRIVFEFEIENGTKEISLSPSHNYAIISSSAWGQARSGRGELEVKHFTEILPGVYFPDRIDYTIYQNDKPFLHRTTQYTDIRANKTLPSSLFHLKFPRNMYVKNLLTSEIYRSDEDGNPISKPLFGTAKTEKKVEKSPLPDPNQPHPQETKEEPKSGSRWLAPLGVTLIVIALVVRARRYRVKEEAK